MGVVRKQSIYSSILVYISMFIGYINLLVLMPNYFSPEEIGMTRSILTFAVFIAGFSELGSSSILYRFFPLYQRYDIKDIVWIIFGLPLIGFLIFSGLVFLSKGILFEFYFKQSPELSNYIPLMIYLTFFTLIGSVASAYCNVHLRTVFPKAINELVPKIGNTILIILYIKGWLSFNQYFIWFCSLTTLSSIIILIYIKYFNGWNTDLKVSALTKRVYKNMIRYGGVAILGSSFLLIILYIDTIMLGGLKGQAEVAKFNIGYYIISIMSVPFVAITAVVVPILSTAIRQKNWQEVLRHYRQTSLNNFIIGSFIFVLLLIIFPEMLRLMRQGVGYESAMYIVLFLGAGRLLDMITGCNSEIIILSKFYIFNLYTIIIVSIIKVILNYYLIQTMGMKGIAISGFVVLLLFNGMRYVYIYHKLGLQPFTIQTLKAIIFILCTSSIAWLLVSNLDLRVSSHMYLSAFIQISIKSIIWSLLFVPGLIYFKISAELNQFYKMVVGRVKGLLKNSG